jgi:hypothetical protein
MALGEPNSLFKAPKPPALPKTNAKNFFQSKSSPYAKGYESPISSEKEAMLGQALGWAGKQLGMGALNFGAKQIPGAGLLVPQLGKGPGAAIGSMAGTANAMGVGDLIASTNPSNKQASITGIPALDKLAFMTMENAKRLANAGAGASIAGEYMLPLIAHKYPDLISPDKADQIGHYLGQLGLGTFAATTAHDMYKNPDAPNAADLLGLGTMMLASHARHGGEHK